MVREINNPKNLPIQYLSEPLDRKDARKAIRTGKERRKNGDYEGAGKSFEEAAESLEQARRGQMIVGDQGYVRKIAIAYNAASKMYREYAESLDEEEKREIYLEKAKSMKRKAERGRSHSGLENQATAQVFLGIISFLLSIYFSSQTITGNAIKSSSFALKTVPIWGIMFFILGCIAFYFAGKK